MFENATSLPEYYTLALANFKSNRKTIGQLGISLLTSILFTAPVLAETRITKPDKLAAFPIRNSKTKPNISLHELGEMGNELERLIGRFRATLLTAEANQANISLSTGQVIDNLLNQDISALKQNNKFKKSNYHNSHIALLQARNRLKRFNNLVNQRQYITAQSEWAAAKQILWDHYPKDLPLAQSEVRGIWFDRGTIVKAKSEADLVEIFDRMAIAGINTIFFETLNSSYTIYPSEVAPQQNPLVKNWDPLKAAVKLAHEREMELHAWVWTFAAANQRHNEILNLPRNYVGPVLSQRPEWGMTDQEGSRFHYTSGKVFLDPANPEVQGYLTALIKEIATEYKVDGIHLDYIRYPFQSPTGQVTYGYSNASREQFYQQTGYDPAQLTPQHPFWSQWTEFRIEQVDNFVANVSQVLKEINPDLTLSTAVFPMPKQERLAKIQQSWEKWVRKEWIDLLIPMTYAQNTEKLNNLTKDLIPEFDSGKALLLPGIRLLDISEVAALDQMQLLRGMSTQGYALFAAENLHPRLAQTFNQIQGSHSNSEPLLPHRQPFETALSRYQHLQQEWNFLLTNNELELNDTTLKLWGEQSQHLESELIKLAEKPSSRNILSTQISLSSLSRQFPRWMKQTQDVDDYQAEVWHNRLDSIDRLLSYGARKNLTNY